MYPAHHISISAGCLKCNAIIKQWGQLKMMRLFSKNSDNLRVNCQEYVSLSRASSFGKVSPLHVFNLLVDFALFFMSI